MTGGLHLAREHTLIALVPCVHSRVPYRIHVGAASLSALFLCVALQLGVVSSLLECAVRDAQLAAVRQPAGQHNDPSPVLAGIILSLITLIIIASITSRSLCTCTKNPLSE